MSFLSESAVYAADFLILYSLFISYFLEFSS
nr:MAG TPA: hypothetical protein [Caudoviricetes sp.]DAQ24634.1 MAG TPA: hypothetical protein [Caudoviricetes sp.]